MNATELLKKDHQEALAIISQLEGAGDGAPDMALFNQLKSALELHTRLEEQLLYPALQNFDETRDQVEESYEEHREVDELLAKMSTPGEDWNDQLDDLKSDLEHHIEEEENEMFPKAQSLLGQTRLEEMGRQMEQMKQGKAATAP